MLLFLLLLLLSDSSFSFVVDFLEIATHSKAPAARHGHATVALSQEKILLFGGSSATENTFQDSWLFQCSNEKHFICGWTALCELCHILPPRRWGHVLQMWDSTSALIHGGFQPGLQYFGDLWLFNTSFPQWQKVIEKTVQPEPRAGHVAAVIEKALFIFGGTNGDFVFEDVWKLESIHGYANWKLICDKKKCGRSPGPRLGVAAVAYGFHFLIFGGNIVDSLQNDVWILDTNSSHYQWLQICSETSCGIAPLPRMSYASLLMWNQQLLIHGGVGKNDLYFNDIWILSLSDPSHILWSKIPNGEQFIHPRSSHTAASFGERNLIIFGGFYQSTVASVFNDSWLLRFPFPTSKASGKFAKLALTCSITICGFCLFLLCVWLCKKRFFFSRCFSYFQYEKVQQEDNELSDSL